MGRLLELPRERYVLRSGIAKLGESKSGGPGGHLVTSWGKRLRKRGQYMGSATDEHRAILRSVVKHPIQTWVIHAYLNPVLYRLSSVSRLCELGFSLSHRDQ